VEKVFGRVEVFQTRRGFVQGKNRQTESDHQDEELLRRRIGESARGQSCKKEEPLVLRRLDDKVFPRKL